MTIVHGVYYSFLDKKGFYQDQENKPDWFPQNITFRAPTHKHGMALTILNITERS